MSTIDVYKHQLLGFIRCPMVYSLYRDGRVLDRLPIYELLEHVEGESSISGAPGDVVIGGGSGEASALRFSIPQLFLCYTHSGQGNGHLEKPITSHWSLTEAFIFGQGFLSLGWFPEQQPLDLWLAGHLMAFLVKTFPEKYGHLPGELSPNHNGSIVEALK
jgi:hypothetical protein